jgi:hypothetical protein
MTRGKWLLAVVPLALAVGCGSSSGTHASAVITPSTASPSAPISTPTASSTPDFGLGLGYPMEVAASSLPHGYGDLLAAQGTTKALILAPNVYTALPAGTSIEAAVDGGSLLGLCAPVKAFVAAHPDQTHSYGCN